VKFFIGLHQCRLVRHFRRACVSINALKRHGIMRKSPVPVQTDTEILLDSGAFTELALHGEYRQSPFAHAQTLGAAIRLFHNCNLIAVAQDYMCEPFMLKKTGGTVRDHQRLTIERYDQLMLHGPPCPVMPVLQGYEMVDYVRHLHNYGTRLRVGAWVGIGSVCKRNRRPHEIVHILDAIKRERPDLRLHGFGVKKTALLHPGVRDLLHSADSMAWSFHHRRTRTGRANDWRAADEFRQEVEHVSELPFVPWQPSLSL
jgi:hypothetical protein